jgi:hypothetical protein
MSGDLTMEVSVQDVMAFMATLTELFEDPAEDLLKVIREELRRRLREGEPPQLWEAAEIYLEHQLSACSDALAAVVQYLQWEFNPPPPSPQESKK